MSGKWYVTDQETIRVLREQVTAGHIKCIAAIMELGLKAGRIKLAEHK
jgi:hypothetical protein